MTRPSQDKWPVDNDNNNNNVEMTTRPPHQIMRTRPPQDKWLTDDVDNGDVGRSDNKAPSVNEDVASAGQMAHGRR